MILLVVVVVIVVLSGRLFSYKRLHHRNWIISVVHAHDLTPKKQTFA